MSRPNRPKRPGPVPLLVPAVGLSLGCALGATWTLPTTGLVAGLAVLVLGFTLLLRGPMTRLGIGAGWLLLGAAMAMPEPQAAPPVRDGALLVRAVLGPAVVGTRHRREARLLEAWPEHHRGVQLPIWQGPLDVQLGTGGAGLAQVGEGADVLVRGRVVHDRRGWVLRPMRGRVEVLASTPVARWRRAARDVRRRIRRVLGAHSSPELRALFVALVLGDRGELDPALQSAFARTGTSHLLAISGLHVGTAWLGARALVRRVVLLLPPSATRTGGALTASAVVAWAGAALYVVLAGAPVSGQRALGMLGAVTLALVVRRRISPWNTLCAAILVVLGLDPSAVGSLGFQLSVASVAFLIAWTPVDEPTIDGWGRARRAVRLALWTGVLGTLATAPLVGRIWGQVPLAGVWTNALAVPLLGAATVPPLLLGSVLGVVSPELAEPWIGLANLTGAAGVGVVRWCASPERAPLWAWQPTAGMIVAVYLSAGWVAVVGRRR